MVLSPHYLLQEKAAQHVRDTWGLPCSPRWLAKLAVTQLTALATGLAHSASSGMPPRPCGTRISSLTGAPDPQ
jgi:hypothetical protein